MNLYSLFFIFGLTITSLFTQSASSYNPAGYFPGVNIAGAEFGKEDVFDKTYFFPRDQEFEYFKSKGFKSIRLPFKWHRLQPELMGDFEEKNLTEIDRCVKTATDLGLVLILDVHSYSKRSTPTQKEAYLGMDPELPDKALHDLWIRLAQRYKENPLVWFGLMNEPYKQTPEMTAATMQSTLLAIRSTGAQNRILVPGTVWTGAHSWITSGNAAAYENFKDPANNFVFEVHQYLDADSSGTKPLAVPDKGATCLVAFTNWAKERKHKAFLGEVGWDGKTNNPQASIEGDALLTYMDQNKEVWTGYTYWAAGRAWGGYMYSVHPEGLGTPKVVDKNQLPILLKHLQ